MGRSKPIIWKRLFVFLAFFILFSSRAYGADVDLFWDADNGLDLAGYKIYYKTGKSGEPYDGTGATEGASPVDVGNVTSFTLHALSNTGTYCFAITATTPAHASGAVDVVITNPDTLSGTLSGGFTYMASSVWWNTGWQNRIKITFDNSAGATDLVDFPAAVSLTSTEIDYTRTQNLGQDIRFVDADDTTDPAYEIEKWDEAGISVVWVKVPRIDSLSTTDFIWMYYNNSSAVDAQNAAAVWDANYKGVWHLDESGDEVGYDYLDSASNANHMQGGQGISTRVPMQTTSEKIPNAQYFLNDDFMYAEYSASLNLSDAGGTISGWFKLDSSDIGSGRIMPIFWKQYHANTSAPDGDALTYEWSFGDGGSSTEMAVFHGQFSVRGPHFHHHVHAG